MRASRVGVAIALAMAILFVGACSVADLTSGDGLEAATSDAIVEPSDATAESAPHADAMDAGADSSECVLLTPPSGPVGIENQGNGRYLEVPLTSPAGSDANPGTAWGTILDVNSFTGASNQFWNFQPVSDDSGTYRILNSLSSDCIDVLGGFTSDGTGLQQYGCFDQNNQHFWVCSADGGSVRIMGEQSGKCLTSVGNKDNAPVYISDCSSSITEQWTLAQ